MGPRSNRPAKLRNTSDAISKTVTLREAIRDFREIDLMRFDVDGRLSKAFRPDHPAADLMHDEWQMVADRHRQAEAKLIRLLRSYTVDDIDHGREPNAPPWKPSGVISEGVLITTEPDSRRPEDDVNPWVVEEDDGKGGRVVRRLVIAQADGIVDLDDCQF